jgi:hypothetical protein
MNLLVQNLTDMLPVSACFAALSPDAGKPVFVVRSA